MVGAQDMGETPVQKGVKGQTRTDHDAAVFTLRYNPQIDGAAATGNVAILDNSRSAALLIACAGTGEDEAGVDAAEAEGVAQRVVRRAV